MLTALAISAISATAVTFFSRRLLCYLRHFQEVGYSTRLFKDWMLTNGIYDRKGSLIATIAAISVELTENVRALPLIMCAIASIALVWLSLWEPDPRIDGYPTLQPTRQARRIYHLALSLYTLSFVVLIVGINLAGAGRDLAVYWLLVIVSIQSSPIWMILASILNRSRSL